MPKYNVGVYENIGGYTSIEANDEAQAQALVQNILDADGIEGLTNFDTTHREFSVVDCIVINEGALQ